jgi:quinol-cytochrome oxidoreductase complex cytochrome b subunit
MTALIVQVLMILVAINIARKSRNQTTWTLPQLHWRMWLSIVGAIVGSLLPVLRPAQPGSPNAILCIAATLLSVFVFAKALYRKADLRKAVPHVAMSN